METTGEAMHGAATDTPPARVDALRVVDWLALALLAAAFVPGLLSLASIWGSIDYYSHGYLVPVVAGLLAMRERDRLETTPASRSTLGLVALALALAIYGLGAAANLPEAQGVAIVGCVAAAVLWIRGPAWLRVLAFPIAYLLFMVPLPEEWLAPVILRLRLFVTETAVALLHAGGLAVLREGNVIGLPNGESLFVADACSGVTSLVTLLPLAVLVAWLTERATWRRLVIVASVVPIALFFNLSRVLGTVVAAERFGAERATAGAVHDMAGLATYVLGCLALLGVGALLRRLSPAS